MCGWMGVWMRRWMDKQHGVSMHTVEYYAAMSEPRPMAKTRWTCAHWLSEETDTEHSVGGSISGDHQQPSLSMAVYYSLPSLISLKAPLVQSLCVCGALPACRQACLPSIVTSASVFFLSLP